MADQLTPEAIAEGLVNLLDGAELVAGGQECVIEFPEAADGSVRAVISGEDGQQIRFAMHVQAPRG
jgi:hypothetical protein